MELLVVMGIIVVMMALIGPAMNAIRGGNNINSAAYDIAGALQAARSYAMANNTYTWIGFFEHDPTDSGTPADDPPPYDKAGRIVIAVVSSKDGTAIFKDSAPGAELTPQKLSMVGTPVRIDNAHLADIGEPAGGDSATLDGRPAAAYTYGQPDDDKYNRLSSESDVATKFYFKAQNYFFHKTIRFSPSGEAEVLVSRGGYDQHETRQIFEIGIKPTHGSAVDENSRNLVAIQLTGIGGNVKVYRR